MCCERRALRSPDANAAVAGGRGPGVTIVHKANVLPVTDGLFRETVLRVARESYPDVRVEEQLVDSCVYVVALYAVPGDAHHRPAPRRADIA